MFEKQVLDTMLFELSTSLETDFILGEESTKSNNLILEALEYAYTHTQPRVEDYNGELVDASNNALDALECYMTIREAVENLSEIYPQEVELYPNDDRFIIYDIMGYLNAVGKIATS